MPTTPFRYNSVTTLLAGEGLGYLTSDIVAVLATSSYTPSVAGHTNLSHITNELTDPSYARVLLTGKAQTFASGILKLDATDTTFLNLVSTAIRYAIFAKKGVSDAASPLIGYWDLGSNQNANVNNFILVYNVNGVFQIAIP